MSKAIPGESHAQGLEIRRVSILRRFDAGWQIYGGGKDDFWPPNRDNQARNNGTRESWHSDECWVRGNGS